MKSNVLKAKTVSRDDQHLLFLEPSLIDMGLQLMSGVIERIDSMVDLSIKPRQVTEEHELTDSQKIREKLAQSKAGKAALGLKRCRSWLQRPLRG